MEMLAEQYIDGDYARHSFLDCSLIYDDPEAPVAALSGLEHLEGMTVGILADGAVCPPRVVEDGRVALDRPAGRVIVGLEYVADLETMPVEIVGQEGASVGRKKQINAVSLLFHRTVGAKVGTSFDRMEIVKWRSTEPHGRPPRPYSGTKNLVIPTLAENVVSVCVRSDEPTRSTPRTCGSGKKNFNWGCWRTEISTRRIPRPLRTNSPRPTRAKTPPLSPNWPRTGTRSG